MSERLGAALMRQAGDWLARGFPDREVYLLVLEMNMPAQRFYERIGGRCAEITTMETHGGAIVRSCRYIWPRPEVLVATCPTS